MKPPAWSFSALKNFLGCPSKYYKTKITKEFVEVWGAETEFGDEFHKCADNYLKFGAKAPLPEKFTQWREYLDRWRALAQKADALYVEHEMALDRSLKPVSWFSKLVWCRAKTDVLVVNGAWAYAGDHKTGKSKKYDESIDQLMITALHVFYYFPKVDTVRCGYYWLKENARPEESTYHRKDIPKMWNLVLPYLKEFKQAFNDEEFPPRQSGLCNGWCPVTSCTFWAPKKDKR
jgi:hypothetical protein